MARPTYPQLLAENRHLRRQVAELTARKDRRIAELEAQVQKLTAQVQRLTSQLQEALRAAKRQAAPFSKGEPKSDPKPPGRKAGDHYGTKAHRPIPSGVPDEVIDVPLPADCPHCRARDSVTEDGLAHQHQVEVPRRPLHRRFDIHLGHCERCSRRVQGRHPLQTSDALGAAASQLGPDAQAILVHLNKHAGLSQGKIADYFRTMFGVRLTPSGVCQALARAARRCQPIYQRILASVPRARRIGADETGWRIGGRQAWMHGLVTPAATVYQVAQGRGHEVAAALIGAGYTGQLLHDGWAPYDRFYDADHQQCLNHLLTRCRELLQTAQGGAVRFPRQVHDLLTDALALRERRDQQLLSAHGLAIASGRLQARLDRLLRWTRTHADNERFAKHLARHREQLFTFLRVPGLDASNWRAEQAMRLAAVNRKVWGGNRTAVGAHTQSVLMTVLATCRQQARDTIDSFSALLRGRQLRLALLPAGP